jgi:DNA-binding NtrC family response regulator
MTNQTQNLFIVEDDQTSAAKLHQFLETKFGTAYNIHTFSDATKALEKVDKHTKIVILDYDYFGEKGNKILEFIKTINPSTEVIILSNHGDIATAIASYNNGATNFLIKNQRTEKQLSSKIFDILSYPAKYLELRYGFSQFFAYLLFCFIIVGFLVFLGMQSI